MVNTIEKRDGRIVQFNPSKIYEAIAKAYSDIKPVAEITIDDINVVKKVTNNIVVNLNTGKIEPKVEAIQDAIEAELMAMGLCDLAKSFIIYRNKRTEIREGKSELYEIIDETIVATNRDNANIQNSPSSKMLQIATAASTKYYLNKLIPKEISKAHTQKEIHIHDLDYYGKTMTCLQIPLGKLLLSGFDNGHGYIRSPKRIGSALALSAIILQSNQNEMFGGQAFAYFDRDIAPFIKREHEFQIKDITSMNETLGGNKTKEELEELAWERTVRATYQAMEGFVYNLNTMHSRAGNQIPFSSICIGMETDKYGRLANEQFLKAYKAGLGKGEQPIFPNVAYKLMKGVSYGEGSPNEDLYELALSTLSVRLFPSFINLDATFNKPYYNANKEHVAYMGE